MKRSIYSFLILVLLLPAEALSSDTSDFMQQNEPSRMSRILLAVNDIDGGDKTDDSIEDKEELPWELLGNRGRHLHLALSLTAVYTDNALNSSSNEQSDLSVYASPELWVTSPRSREKPDDIRSASSKVPGGLNLGRSSPAMNRKYQAHLMYKADIPVLSDNSPSDDKTSYRMGGGIIYKGNRFVLDVVDRYMVAFEERGTGASASSDAGEHDSNLFHAIFTYNTRSRFRVRLDYSHFYLDYSDSQNSFRERSDNAYSLFIFYKVRPRTAVFAEYDLIDVSYDSDPTHDSTEHHIMGGVQWDVTAKTTGIAKAGYGTKNFSNVNVDAGNLILEAQIHHKFTPKTSLLFSAFGKTNESDLQQAYYVVSYGAEAEYQQMLTARITGLARLSLISDGYEEAITFMSQTGKRSDNTTEAALGVQYVFKRWLEASAGYSLTIRESNFNYFDYVANTLFVRITGKI
ncbi:MAG: outer membrane beta-barrel protein [Nitrospirota bacterium]|nr:MAG: outer membrane beta-barrel protein [Nitrospirota bacterium]